MLTKIQLLLCLLCLQQICVAQLTSISKTAKDQLYVHTDKDYYLKGATIYYKIYLGDQSRILGSSKSEVVYIDLINELGEIEQARTIKTTDGVGLGSFDLSSFGNGGTYALRAYTNHMRNFHPRDFFRKLLLVENGKSDFANKANEQKINSDNYSISIYPEGGHFVDGIENEILFHCTNKQGSPQSIEFELLENGEKLSIIKSNKFGFAKTTILPNKVTNYEIKSGNSITEFPAITEASLSIKATIKEETLTTTIISLKKPTNYALHLIQGNNTIVQKELSDKSINEFSFNLENLPTGIIRCIIVNSKKQIVAERHVFNHLAINNYNADVQFDQEQYNKRSLVNLSLDFYDDEGESLPGNYSISIVDRYLNKKIVNNHNIQSNNFLSSGTFYPSLSPSIFINEDGETNLELIDQFMILHGNSSNELITSKTLQYKAETQYSINGKIHSKNNKDKGISSSGEMNVLQPILDTYSFHSDENGLFTIQTSIPSETVDVLFKLGDIKKNQSRQSNIKVNKKLDVTIFDQVKPEVDNYTKHLMKHMSIKDKETLDKVTLDRYERILLLENSPDIAMSDTIEEISIKGKSIDRFIKESKKTMLYSRPNTRIIAEDIPQLNLYDDIYDILRARASGIEITLPEPGETSRFSVIMRGRTSGLSSVSESNAAQFMINGSFVSASTVEALHPTQIAFIDIISSLNQLTPYGQQGVNGIINVYLNEFTEDSRPLPKSKDSDFIAKKVNGFHLSKPFNLPNYSIESNEHPKFDSRTTLYWNPNLIVDESGEAIIQFYTGDRNTIYDVIVEGIAENGMPVHATSEFIVTNK